MSDATMNETETEIAIGAPPGLAPTSHTPGGSKKVAIVFAMLALVAALVYAVLMVTLWIDWTSY